MGKSLKINSKNVSICVVTFNNCDFFFQIFVFQRNHGRCCDGYMYNDTLEICVGMSMIKFVSQYL